MPLKQEQASPERPRCMGGANEHWGFRNPSGRQTEQRENVSGLKATLTDKKAKAKDFQTTPGSFVRRLKQKFKMYFKLHSQRLLTSECNSPTCLNQLHSMYPGRKRRGRKKKKVRKSHAEERGERLFSGRVPDSAEVPSGAVRGRLTVYLWGHGRSSFNKELIIRHNEATK